MKLHVPSFFIGVTVGAGGALIAPRLRAVALEIATTFYRIGDAVVVRVARGREDISDLLAEAKARARHAPSPTSPRSPAEARRPTAEA